MANKSSLHDFPDRHRVLGLSSWTVVTPWTQAASHWEYPVVCGHSFLKILPLMIRCLWRMSILYGVTENEDTLAGTWDFRMMESLPREGHIGLETPDGAFWFSLLREQGGGKKKGCYRDSGIWYTFIYFSQEACWNWQINSALGANIYARPPENGVSCNVLLPHVALSIWKS